MFKFSYKYILVLILCVLLFIFWIQTDNFSNKNTTTPLPATYDFSTENSTNNQSSGFDAINKYMGNQSCIGCHDQQLALWKNSHHDQSMQKANKNTVKGNFNDISFSQPYNNTTSHFYQKNDLFYVHTLGENGQLQEYEVLYTLGTEPLQQYIVSLPQGRLQMLPIAWDTQKNRWYDLQKDKKPRVKEWIHWTQGGSNWNSMCADCHTTNLHKNYDLDDSSYETSWAAEDVSCEACHGPAEKHINTVKNTNYKLGISNPYIDMQTTDLPKVIVDKCGKCHARRQQLTTTSSHKSDTLLDHYFPEVLREGLYQKDGQILDEVFVYGSFLQSKMYHRGISCINCHEPHTTKLKRQGNALCTSCHSEIDYDAEQHHHHKTNHSGSQCVDCHMPGRTYMGNDYRHDHSFRVPRPDLSIKYQTPNACNNCHQKRSSQWASNAINQWFGLTRQPHFSEVLARTADDPTGSIKPLIDLLKNKGEPAIVRATTAHRLSKLINQPGVYPALLEATKDKEALVRTIAANSFASLPRKVKIQTLSPLLMDTIRSVRISAARGLTEIPSSEIAQQYQQAFQKAQYEYQESLAINADFPSGRHNIAMDNEKKGQLQLAEQGYKEALLIDNHNNTIRMNLAHLYYRQNRLADAENIYRTIITQEPDATAPQYALGLLLSEQGRIAEAEVFIARAAHKSENHRIWYNLAVIRHQGKSMALAEKAYKKALLLSPNNMDIINGLTRLYLQKEQWQKAEIIVQEFIVLNPQNDQAQQLYLYIQQIKNQ